MSLSYLVGMSCLISINIKIFLCKASPCRGFKKIIHHENGKLSSPPQYVKARTET